MKNIVFLVILMLMSCNGQKKTTGNNNTTGEEANNTSPLSLLLTDNYSGADSTETLVVKDEKALKNFFSKINRTRKPGLPVPKVDFSKDMVIIHCSGEAVNAALVELYVKEESEDSVHIATKKRDKKENTTAAMSPFSVYTIPLTKKEIVIENRE